MLTIQQAEVVASAIYITEGGSKTHYPYGIKSVRTENPHAICINTILHCSRTYNVTSVDRYFITVLADKYCPISSDKQGNINWKHNMIRILHL